MSKYKQRGAYHYTEFNANTPYRHHVEDLVIQVTGRVSKQLLLPKVIEIGAGEGLILSRFEIHAGYSCKGCDLDMAAVELAHAKKNNVKLGSVEIFAGEKADVVLLCDVLEHVPHPVAMMASACKLAPMVVIAIPDRPDAHAIHEPQPGPFIEAMKRNGFDCVYRAQRHARHLMIFEKQ
jgi:2-polyprenyl-3-methyl-5-hydroxy-6-metoxy-1,4-benzoquinol methylase